MDQITFISFHKISYIHDWYLISQITEHNEEVYP